MINIKECAKDLVEREDCKFIGSDKDGHGEHYTNNELDVYYYENGPSIVINFQDEQSLDKKNSARIISSGDDSIIPYVHFVFTFPDRERLKISFEEDRVMHFYTPSRGHIKCTRQDTGKIYWDEKDSNGRLKFDLFEYGVQKLVDDILAIVSEDINSPRFALLFEMIRPYLVMSILEISVKRIQLLTCWMQSDLSAIQEYNIKIANPDTDNPFEIARMKSKREDLFKEVKELEAEIDSIKINVAKEYDTLNGGKQKA